MSNKLVVKIKGTIPKINQLDFIKMLRYNHIIDGLKEANNIFCKINDGHIVTIEVDEYALDKLMEFDTLQIKFPLESFEG